MIDTVFFDIGGVLLNIYPERTIEYLSSLTKLSSQDIIDSFPEDKHHQYERGEISDEEFYSAIKDSLTQTDNLTRGEFWKAWGMMVGDKKETVAIMDQLSDVYSIWLLSNTNPYHIIKEERLKIFSGISGAIYSYNVGYRKPDIEIYEKALELANTSASKSLFVDDLYENILAANELNFNTIHYNSFDDFKEKLKSLGLL